MMRSSNPTRRTSCTYNEIQELAQMIMHANGYFNDYNNQNIEDFYTLLYPYR
ncbi:hypothetical protein HMA55_10685 [Corynebacterium sp. zg-913]|uniref:Uncharacterized protein n=1 Tax=Corynebacterium wankanglinii TaxID=2735136 RepID=A0A7H0KBB9_9CORY|nr:MULTISPECIES: hypothetical protein [Corynebacterium]MBA1836292.1 hypothetical protein [Corynebacterium wankanglinii]MBA1838341.1 hypothetical protein [Corynebacterium wankanglinii]QNP94585.1 hypothetical protein IA203_03420 [Corynebacterium wankanglinii]